ncbi:MAG: mandelate racemase, partial [Alphaproteobacteria bacterium]
MKFCFVETEKFEWRFSLRMPFRFGVITVRDGIQAVVRVRIRDATGREGFGLAAETLAAKWFDKDAALSDADNQHQLRRALEIAEAQSRDAGFNTAFGHYA